MTDVSKVVEALNELTRWLEHTSYSEHIREIIRRLEAPDTSASELRQLKSELSTENLFHLKCLGDVYVPDFSGDGTPYAWWNYLYSVAEICQKNL